MSQPQPPAELASLTRRQIVKQFSICTAASIIGGKLWTGRLLADVTSGANTGVIEIKVGDYPALADEYGSVQFKITSVQALGTSGGVSLYPITVTRDGNSNIFHAVDTNCTHDHNRVNPYDSMAGTMTCPVHGATYSISGQLLAPADPNQVDSLLCYPASYNLSTDILSIEVPGLLQRITTVNVQSTTATTIRLRLQFPSLNNLVSYRVMYRPNLTTAPQFVNFATTATGPTSASSIFGNSSTRTVYVDASGTTGFYSIVIPVTLW